MGKNTHCIQQDGAGGGGGGDEAGKGGKMVRAGVTFVRKPAHGWEGARGYREKRKQVQKSWVVSRLESDRESVEGGRSGRGLA